MVPIMRVTNYEKANEWVHKVIPQKGLGVEIVIV